MSRMLTRALVAWPMFVVALTAAQAPPPPTTPPPAPPATWITVGSGNFFSPIVADLDRAIAFYRDGLGLEFAPPADADANPGVRHMFGLPDAALRWAVGRPPGMRSGVEIVTADRIARKPLSRRMQDPGAFTLILVVRDLGGVLAAVKRAGGVVTSLNDRPVKVPMGAGWAQAVTLRAPDGHFIELVSPEFPLATSAPTGAAILEVRVRLTVDDVERSMRLYRNALGVHMQEDGEFTLDPDVTDMLGVAGGQFRLAITRVPVTGLVLEFIQFKAVSRKSVRGAVQDPGSTRLQLQVRDVDEAITAARAAGGQVVSSRGIPADLPGRNGATTRAAIVRDPDNLFLVLIQAPRAAD